MLFYENPDFIVLSGDQISADYINEDAAAYYEALADTLEPFGIPWALLFGNKDVDNFGNTTAKTSRETLALTDMLNPLSLTRLGPAELFGVSNYYIDIMYRNETATRVFMFDTGGGELPSVIEQNQVDWFTNNNDPSIPVVAFQHIPGPNADFKYDSGRCVGMKESGIGGVDSDAGLYDVLAYAGNVKGTWYFVSCDKGFESSPRISKSHIRSSYSNLFANKKVLGVGHRHGLGFCCTHPVTDFSFCYGRRTGDGGLKPGLPKGARVYNLQLLPNGTFAGWTSHVRMKSSAIIDEFDPLNYAKF